MEMYAAKLGSFIGEIITMGKILFTASLLTGSLVSQFTYSQCVTGSTSVGNGSYAQTGTYCPPAGNLGAFNGSTGSPGYYGPGTSYYPLEYYKAMEEQAKQRAAAERKFCTSNKGSIIFEYEKCIDKAKTQFSTDTASCPTEAKIITELNPVIGRIEVTTTPNATCIKQKERERDARISNCNINTGYSMCKSHGII